MKDTYSMKPIAYLCTTQKERYAAARQATVAYDSGESYLQLTGAYDFAQMLEGLEGFSHVWLIFVFHKAEGVKSKVQPPRGDKKRGVLATRSPHRPNHIGMTCVELLRIEGCRLYIAGHDLLDETPILDVKPYLTYADSFPQASLAWLEEVDESIWTVQLSENARKQLEFLDLHSQWSIRDLVFATLTHSALPKKGHRVKLLDEKKALYEFACKTWRVEYKLKGKQLLLLRFYSGYSQHDLFHEVDSKWQDIREHLNFIVNFGQKKPPC